MWVTGSRQTIFSRAFKRIGWTLLAVGVLLYLIWGGQVLNQGATGPPVTVNATDAFSVAGHGFWTGLGAPKKHVFDAKLAAAVITYLKKENASSVLELGAGMGLYAKQLKSEGIFVSCYDGNPDTQALSDGRCGVIDLSQPLDLSNHDWVLSFEVGEHIPKVFEKIFIANLDRGNRYGMILSWAVEGQGGTSHVNSRNNSYIRATLTSMGFVSDFEAEKALRTAAKMRWFKNTIMVFKRSLTE